MCVRVCHACDLKKWQEVGWVVARQHIGQSKLCRAGRFSFYKIVVNLIYSMQWAADEFGEFATCRSNRFSFKKACRWLTLMALRKSATRR